MAAKVKKAEQTLEELAKELGIPADVAEEAIEVAQKTGDPAEYLRRFAAEAQEMSNDQAPVTNGQGHLEPGPAEDPMTGCLLASISEIPLATMIGDRTIDENWPPRIGHLHLQLDGKEKPLKDALVRLYHGLQETNARLRGRTPDEPPRPIKNHVDALKWLLEQISLTP